MMHQTAQSTNLTPKRSRNVRRCGRCLGLCVDRPAHGLPLAWSSIEVLHIHSRQPVEVVFCEPCGRELYTLGGEDASWVLAA